MDCLAEILQLTVGAYEPENATLPFGSAKITVPVEGFTYMPGEQPAIKTLGGNATECADPKEVVVSPATHNVGRHCIYTGGEKSTFLPFETNLPANGRTSPIWQILGRQDKLRTSSGQGAYG